MSITTDRKPATLSIVFYVDEELEQHRLSLPGPCTPETAFEHAPTGSLFFHITHFVPVTKARTLTVSEQGSRSYAMTEFHKPPDLY